MSALKSTAIDRFRRFLLPGLAFKAVVIGGGYATGRELAEFFLPSGPLGGLVAMILATLIWGVVSAATFRLAYQVGAQDYRSFFKSLLGRGWFAFELAYALFVIIVLAVFGAAAGEIGAATIGAPPLAGTLVLMFSIIFCVAFGNAGVEWLFFCVSVLLYATYAGFLALALTGVGAQIGVAFRTSPPPSGAWAMGGVTYAASTLLERSSSFP